MKKSILILSVMVCSLITTKAQTNENVQLKKMGIGLHVEQFRLNDFVDQTTPVNKIVITYNPTQWLRIEPEFGYKDINNKQSERKATIYNFGLGTFAQFQRNKLNFYGGARFEYTSITEEENIKYNSEKLAFGPAMGAEYFLGENFSFGGEIGLTFAKVNTEGENILSFTSTNTGLFLRFYF